METTLVTQAYMFGLSTYYPPALPKPRSDDLTRAQRDYKTAVVLRNRLVKYWETANDWHPHAKDRLGNDCFITHVHTEYAKGNSLSTKVAAKAYEALADPINPFIQPKSRALIHLNKVIWKAKRGRTPRLAVKAILSTRMHLRTLGRALCAHQARSTQSSLRLATST